jgi:hypothetical protein
MANPLANVKPSPRVRMAARLYATGACKTKKEASALAGLHPNYLTMLTGQAIGSEPVKRLVNDLTEMLDDETVATSVIIHKLGRQAIKRISQLMYSDSEHISLKAAQDLADRAPDTSKTQKVSIDSFTLSGQDAKELAAALVESATRSAQFDQITTEGLIEVKDIENLLAETIEASPASDERPVEG